MLNIYSSFRPLERLLQYVGFVPLLWFEQGFQKRSIPKIMLNCSNVILNIIVCVLIPIIFEQDYLTRSVHASSSNVSRFLLTSFTIKLITYCQPLASILIGNVQADCLKNILQDLDHFDVQLKCACKTSVNFGHHRTQAFNFIRCYILFSGCVLQMQFYFLSRLILTNLSSVQYVLYLIANCTQVYVTVQFVSSRFNLRS
ncbi:uncharacterized protein LOC128093273 [Culex pipiens pallens]|uniref:uncharacterized protein LOC128093273 n=1 Tax=Culex pipiens pallens TaxID=42434 RepID=UPI0022AA10A7|nr:uncharacterized protein LOC128093273 [Culex pipiens pallens]